MSIFDKYPSMNDPQFIAGYSLSDCYTVANRDDPILDLDVAVALMRFGGNVSEVAGALKKSRRVIDTFIFRDLHLQDLKEDIRDAFMDDVEKKAHEATLAGDIGLMRFMLETLGKSRGYVKRLEATGAGGKDLNVVFFLPENGRESTKEDETADQ